MQSSSFRFTDISRATCLSNLDKAELVVLDHVHLDHGLEALVAVGLTTEVQVHDGRLLRTPVVTRSPTCHPFRMRRHRKPGDRDSGQAWQQEQAGRQSPTTSEIDTLLRQKCRGHVSVRHTMRGRDRACLGVQEVPVAGTGEKGRVGRADWVR